MCTQSPFRPDRLLHTAHATPSACGGSVTMCTPSPSRPDRLLRNSHATHTNKRTTPATPSTWLLVHQAKWQAGGLLGHLPPSRPISHLHFRVHMECHHVHSIPIPPGSLAPQSPCHPECIWRECHHVHSIPIPPGSLAPQCPCHPHQQTHNTCHTLHLVACDSSQEASVWPAWSPSTLPAHLPPTPSSA